MGQQVVTTVESVEDVAVAVLRAHAQHCIAVMPADVLAEMLGTLTKFAGLAMPDLSVSHAADLPRGAEKLFEIARPPQH